MIIKPSDIHGVYTIHEEAYTDERGYFSRIYCEEELDKHKLNIQLKQSNLSHNLQTGTIRGLHYQDQPHQETKFIRCISGAIYDVVIDLRRDSPTYLSKQGFELSPSTTQSIYIPKGCAHGYQTLTKDTSILYLVDENYHPESESGIRWDDPHFSIAWPLEPSIISKKDRAIPDWQEA